MTPEWTMRINANWFGQIGQPRAEFGVEVAGAGDVDGDGFDDVIVGAYLWDGNESAEGAAFVYRGGATGVEAASLWRGESNLVGWHFGRAVRGAGDVNGDGFADIIVGGPTFADSPEDGDFRPKAYVYLGSATGPSPTPDWEVQSPQFGDRFGRAVGTAGDVNGDGFDDVVVSAYFHDSPLDTTLVNAGGLAVYLGSATGLSTHHDWFVVSDDAGAGLGWGAATAGDVNGDGFADLIGGAPKYDSGRGEAGRVSVWLGSAAGLPTVAEWQVDSPDSGADFGRSVASAGDVNGDGFDDVIIGARLHDAPGSRQKEGAAYLYLGSATGLSTTAAWTAFGPNSSSFFGNYVAGAGDINGDGFDDVIVGAPLANVTDSTGTLEGAGQVFLYLGGPQGLAANPALIIDGDQAGGHFGFSLWSAGDVDSDGLSDIIVGAKDYNAGDGASYVYHGASLRFLLEATPLFGQERDVVDFATVRPSDYVEGAQYAALGGNDRVTLPRDNAAATAAGYDTGRLFDAGAGDDYVAGGSLADRISGSDGGDALFGAAGADSLDGGAGMDLLSGGGGKDVLTDRAGAVFIGGGGGNLFHSGGGRDLFVLGGGGVNVLADDSTFDFATDRVAVVGQSAPMDLEAFITSNFVISGEYSGLALNGTTFLTRGQAGLGTLQDWLDHGADIIEFHQSIDGLLAREGLGWAL
jgi:hypothetical protein